MDPILSSITLRQLAIVEDQLYNNEVDDDDDLHAHFVAAGLTQEQATRALSYRDAYSQNIFMEGQTPILKSDHALRYDLDRGDFERWKP